MENSTYVTKWVCVFVKMELNEISSSNIYLTYFSSSSIQNNDNDWLPDNDFNLDPIFADELLTNVADFGTQAGDLLTMEMDDMLGINNTNSPMFNAENYSNNDPIYSSAASDSGLSSDNLDLYVTSIKFHN